MGPQSVYAPQFIHADTENVLKKQTLFIKTMFSLQTMQSFILFLTVKHIFFFK